jgi:hypothetical protein
MQVCGYCKVEKQLEEFHKNKRSKSGRHSRCKVCDKKYRKQFLKRKYAYGKQWREENRAYIIEWRKKNPKYALKPPRVLLTKAEKNSRERKYKRKKYKNDPVFRIKCSLRSRLCQALKNNWKSGNTLELLGCTVEYLKNHLEDRFQEGMTWENHGEWHIDHIRPCASFDLSKTEQQGECFHYTNLQPLWAFDNLSKGSKLTS